MSTMSHVWFLLTPGSILLHWTDRTRVAAAHSWICGVKFSPDDSRFATVSNDSGFHSYNTHQSTMVISCSTQVVKVRPTQHRWTD
ncbi:hypothetical protein PISMIDRAFT_345761 [Pisolithus microcarpus 441]|uniref:Uncharacterized protein n=1 Tax=Pisolithus microcarpus 441 TaxID=765257 RepID=A0A0C9Z3T4_9AGAM|nr:hypothetical protein PISMIDRAFT_345761 [Pisolithus microcarpus 441]